ncbi:MAG: NAD-dependent epimerase/dehydratase family protein, partial [Lachnospiraceae bacterium]
MRCLSDHYCFIRRMINEGLKQILVMGTMHEVGYWEGAIEENTPCNPSSLYGIAKDSLRRAVFAMCKGRDVTVQWLRAYYIYGDDRRSASIFGKLCAAEERGQEFFPFTSGKNKYDFIEVKQLAKMIAATAMQTEVAGIINCCTGVPVSLAEQVEGYIQSRNMKIRLQYGTFPDRPYDSPGVWGDPEKIQRIMGKLETQS